MKRVFTTAVFFATFICFMTARFGYSQDDIKSPNVAGQFYSDDPGQLSREIDKYLGAATIAPFDKKIPLIIVPHAGYVYSAPVAAYSYKAVSKNSYKTIVVIGLSHFHDFEGFSIWPKGSFKTPLGSIEVDNDFSQKLLGATHRIQPLEQSFEREHSLEVQLPFLQKVFSDFKIVPILTGRPNLKDCQDLAASLSQTIGNRDDVLIVISSDMSHYHDDKAARQLDGTALSVIKKLDVENFWIRALTRRGLEMCNFTAVATALFFAKEKNLEADILSYANSGDVTGDKGRVVGYCAVAFHKKGDGNGAAKEFPPNSSVNSSNELTGPQKKRLLEIARNTIESYIQKGEILAVAESDPRLSWEEGAFVTIRKHNDLRGCIGNVLGKGPLSLTVRDMAIAAATSDPRFSPLTKDELKDIDVEVSVLSKPWRVKSVDEIQMGVHGVIIGRGSHRGLFLPQVATETGWPKEKFLSVLCTQKAGLPSNAWKDPQMPIEIFTAQVFSEKDFQ